MLGEDILLEIDATLDQLIHNAEAIQQAKGLSEIESEAFQKTQESLLHHLMHLDQTLATKRASLKVVDKRSASYRIQQKLHKFETLKSKYRPARRTTPIFSKRKEKRTLQPL